MLNFAAASFVAAIIGALATDATTIAGSDWEGPDFLLGCVAMTALWWRDRKPLLIASVVFTCGAIAPFASGAAIVGLFTVAAHKVVRPLVLSAIAYAATA